MVSATSGEGFMVSGFARVNVRNDAYFLGYSSLEKNMQLQAFDSNSEGGKLALEL